MNPVGPRSVYDEAKRFSEALCMAHHRTLGTNVGIARIFNTYGPRLRPADGRVVSNFVLQAMRGEPLTVYGDGSQTRSLCYVADEVAGLVALFDSDLTGPINVGNPDEYTVLELAHTVVELLGSTSTIIHRPLPVDDPALRQPDISKARAALGWEPTTVAAGWPAAHRGVPGRRRRHQAARHRPILGGQTVKTSDATPQGERGDRFHG